MRAEAESRGSRPNGPHGGWMCRWYNSGDVLIGLATHHFRRHKRAVRQLAEGLDSATVGARGLGLDRKLPVEGSGRKFNLVRRASAGALKSTRHPARHRAVEPCLRRLAANYVEQRVYEDLSFDGFARQEVRFWGLPPLQHLTGRKAKASMSASGTAFRKDRRVPPIANGTRIPASRPCERIRWIAWARRQADAGEKE